MKSTMRLLDGSTHYHWEARRILQQSINKGWPFIRELKYEVVMLPRQLVSTPICTYAHPATPSLIPLGIDDASFVHGPWGLA